MTTETRVTVAQNGDSSIKKPDTEQNSSLTFNFAV